MVDQGRLGRLLTQGGSVGFVALAQGAVGTEGESVGARYRLRF